MASENRVAVGGVAMLIAVVYGYIALVRGKEMPDQSVHDTTIKLTETHHA